MYEIYFSYFIYILNYYHITSLPQQIFFSKICLPDCSISKIRRATWRQFGDRVRRHYQHYVSQDNSITISNEVVVEQVKDRHF